MILTPKQVADILADFQRRCDLARMVGIPHYKVVEDNRKPVGHWFDYMTQYWIPDGVQLDASQAVH